MKKRDFYIEKIYNLLNEDDSTDNLTMMEIAGRLGITKMTLYNNFKDKNEMLEAVINYRSIKYKEFLSGMKREQINAIEELMGVLRFQHENPLPFISRIHKSIYDNYPEKFAHYYSHFKESLQEFICQNILSGQQQGLYRDDIDAGQISNYLITTMEGMFDKILKNNGELIDLSEVHRELISYHLRGIISKKGNELMERMGHSRGGKR